MGFSLLNRYSEKNRLHQKLMLSPYIKNIHKSSRLIKVNLYSHQDYQ